MNRINKKNKKLKGNSIANYQLQKKEQAIEKKREQFKKEAQIKVR